STRGRLVQPHVHLPSRPAAYDRGGLPLAAATRVPHSRMLGLQSWGSMATSIMHGPSPRIAVPATPMIAVVPRKLRLVIILASFHRSLLAAPSHVALEPA